MRTLFVIESRACERADWQPWPAQAPFGVKADAEAQAELLNSREPKPTRSWMAYREFRAVEKPAACPKCIAGAVGQVCQWHELKAEQGVAVPAPRSVASLERRPMQPTLRPRNLDGTFTTRTSSPPSRASLCLRETRRHTSRLATDPPMGTGEGSPA